MQAVGDEPLVPLLVARHQPGARFHEDDGVDLDRLAGAPRGVRHQIDRGADGGRKGRRDGDACARRDRRLGHGPVDAEDRQRGLRRSVVGAGADGGAGAKHHASAAAGLQQGRARARPDLLREPAGLDRIRQQRRLHDMAHRDIGPQLAVQRVEHRSQSRHRVYQNQVAAVSATHRPLPRPLCAVASR